MIDISRLKLNDSDLEDEHNIKQAIFKDIRQEKIEKNLRELKNIPYDDIQDEIIMAFAGYEIEGSTEIIVNELETGKKYEAYINHSDSKSFIIYTSTNPESPDLIDLLSVNKVEIC